MWEGPNYTGARLLWSKYRFGPYKPQAPNSTSKYGVPTRNRFGAYIGILCDIGLYSLFGAVQSGPEILGPDQTVTSLSITHRLNAGGGTG